MRQPSARTVGAFMDGGERCDRRDSNPHGLPHRILSPARLPVPPRSRDCPASTYVLLTRRVSVGLCRWCAVAPRRSPQEYGKINYRTHPPVTVSRASQGTARAYVTSRSHVWIVRSRVRDS